MGIRVRRAGRVTVAVVMATACRRDGKAVVHEVVGAEPSAGAEFPREYRAFGTLAAAWP
jgi:hypothetical protein